MTQGRCGAVAAEFCHVALALLDLEARGQRRAVLYYVRREEHSDLRLVSLVAGLLWLLFGGADVKKRGAERAGAPALLPVCPVGSKTLGGPITFPKGAWPNTCQKIYPGED